ncbi:Glycine betaine ABC transport system, permease protein OpuAB / Glycine betaine ABC transport system, glycine betaine-binding protein OpuAC [Granulicella sibirica]|uniref:Glycine betaine ABC transport system, permease protein OpuAB / Glycine betaine ABC transport system, glycine betaine-binding protein OpuAC n=1 Tax=Granulicella sibirica TaxID=2479048 RepID=A0A4Q0T315_9BACT|nr:ABC transporter permease [Granulicella sibirica]RXH55931.1 Glycine betaine ABC transport system, permease protein OpuAB / Glycine betaine ABC transport system, glycine betaine-binding protein OpuAC [Granulicella sibirica]
MTGLRHFFVANGWTIGRLTFEHLWLTVSAMLLAGALGLPLGVLLARRQGLAGPVIAFANVVQVIPSLALFGLLLPVPWLGENAARLAILALTGYALLPILRNTYAGITSVDPALVDVANALGMTPWQRLRKVELPLAASVILAGVRTATVTCVGVATIAAAIGAGGLGELIFRGVASVDNGLVLAGAIPAAFLALGADAGLGFLEKKLAVKRV